MYNLKFILSSIDYKCNREITDDFSVSAVLSDSKKIIPGCLFVCLKGIRHNSHNYINEVIRRGASVIVCDKYCKFKSENALVIYVDNPHEALAKLISRAFGEAYKRMKLIAVTGTNGKTTVTNMLHSALTYLGEKTALIGTLGGFYNGEKTEFSSMTTPDPEILYPLLKKYAAAGARYVVMEISSHALALCKADGLHFNVAAITNITPEHLDFHGDMENYMSAKAKLFSMCDTGVFCVDDEFTTKIFKKSDCKNKISCSIIDKNSDYFAADITLNGMNGCSFTARNFEGGTRIISPIPGSFTVSNALLAYTVLRSLGFSSGEASKGVTSLQSVRGRMERVPVNANFDVIIDFAHTPDALSKLLQSVRAMRKNGQRIVTLFGCGGDRDKSKRSLMGVVASQLSDFVIITSDNSRTESKSTIISDILLGFDNNCPHIQIDDRKKAIEYAVNNSEKGDIILLCGKGHEEYEIDSNGIHPFSEREIVLGLLKNKLNGDINDRK